MATDTNSLMLHIKMNVLSSIRLSYRFVCDYPVVLGVGILLLFLHSSCPSLFAFLLSSSPVFLLTALLLGALLSYGEPNVPETEEVPKDQQMMSLKSKISITDCSMKEVEHVTVERHREKTVDSEEVCVEERPWHDDLHGTSCKEENATPMTRDAHLDAESSEHAESNVTVEREELVKLVSEKVIGLQQGEGIKPESDCASVENQYQFGEFMSSCWQPAIKQDPCSDSESDLTESSSDASMADIIPMLEGLQPQIDKEAGGDDDSEEEEDDDDDDSSKGEEDGNMENEGANGKKENGDGDTVRWTEDTQKDVMDLNSSEQEKNSKLESLMESRRAKNFLKFELDKSLVDMWAADAMRKMEDASRFRVHVPSISTPRPKPFDISHDSEETIELPKIPDSAPSVLLPTRNPFDVPFDQIVDLSSQSRETWSPSAPQHRRHGNFNTDLRQDKNSSRFNPCFTKLETDETIVTDAHNSHSDSDTEQNENNGKLFGPSEAHISEETTILNPTILDAGPLEVNHGMDEAMRDASSSYEKDSFPIQKSISSTSEAEVSINAGSQHSTLYPSSEVINSELHVVEASCIEEISTLFKHRMEKVLVQSVSESSIGQPLTILRNELGEPLSLDAGMHVIEATSVEEMNMLFKQIEVESNAQSDSTSDSPPVTKHDPEWTAYNSEMHIIEASSIEEIKSVFKQVHEAQAQSLLQSAPADLLAVNLEVLRGGFSADTEHAVHNSELHVLEASSTNEISLLFEKIQGEAQARSVSNYHLGEESPECTNIDQISHYSELHEVEARSVEEISSMFKQLHEESQVTEIPESASDIRKTEQSSEMHVIESGSIEELNSEFTQLSEEVQIQAASMTISTAGDQQPSHSPELQVIEAKSTEDIDLFVKQHHEEAQNHAVLEPLDQKIENLATVTLPSRSELHVLEASSVEEINTVFKKLSDEIGIHNVSDPTSKYEDMSSESNPAHGEPVVVELEQSHDSPTDEHAQERGGTASNMLVLEANTSGDIDSAFEQLSKSHGKTNRSQDGEMELEPVKLNSALQVIEAKSLDDTHLALKNLPDDSSESASKVTELKDLHERVEHSVLKVHPAEEM